MDAILRQDDGVVDLTTTAARVAGELIQLADGRAGAQHAAVAAGGLATLQTEGQFRVTKASGVVVIKGAPLWWDHSANSATPVPPTGSASGDRDFFIGVALTDETSSATTVDVELNVKPRYIVDLHESDGATTVVKTAGTPYIYSRGGSLVLGFSTTAEAQKLDWLSKRSWSVSAPWVAEFVVEVVTNGDANAPDLSIGVANGTHASDADSIAESAFFHLDPGNDLNIYAESDDGTTEVAATDTTLDWAVGTPVHLVLDGRDSSNVKYYVNGVEVLAATANLGNIAAATGPLKLLLHLEKSADDTPGEVRIGHACVRIMEQAA